MKKVIFSLKSIALVAMASVAMVSCGDDDPAPAPAPTPDPSLTENFVKFDGDEFAVTGSEYTIDVVKVEGKTVERIYNLTSGGQPVDGKFVKFTTYFYDTDVERPTTLADFAVYGQVSYFVKLKDVKLDDKGNVVDYVVVLPHEAEQFLYAGAGALASGTAFGTSLASNPVLNVNSLVLAEEGGSTDFDGVINYNTGAVEFDFNGATGLFVNDVTPAPAAKGVTDVRAEFNKIVAEQTNSSIKAVEVKNLK